MNNLQEELIFDQREYKKNFSDGAQIGNESLEDKSAEIEFNEIENEIFRATSTEEQNFNVLPKPVELPKATEMQFLLDSKIWNFELFPQAEETNEVFSYKFQELRRKSECFSNNSTANTSPTTPLLTPGESPILTRCSNASKESISSNESNCGTNSDYSSNGLNSVNEVNTACNSNITSPMISSSDLKSSGSRRNTKFPTDNIPNEYYNLSYNIHKEHPKVNNNYENCNTQNNQMNQNYNNQMYFGNFLSIINSNPKEYYPKQKVKFLDDDAKRINIEQILRGKDKRTTLMIRHIPNKYKLQTILEDINMEFQGKYDLFYLPLDFANNCNLGYAFINFVDSFHIIQFYEAFRGKKWRRFKSDKICELAYAKFQGKKDLIAHFEKGATMNFDSEDKKPLILPTPDPLPPVSIPIKYYMEFSTIYPWAKYDICRDKLVIHSLYGF